jgi:hypothetical protein
MIKNAKLIAKDYDAELYHKQEHPRGNPNLVMSRSQLAVFAQCPSRWLEGFSREDSDATDWGSLIDCLVLTPQMFDDKFAAKPATYEDQKSGETKPWNGNATVCKQWAAEQEGKKLVSAEDFEQAKIAVARLWKDEAIKDFIDSSDKQVYCTAEWHDPGTGLVIPVKTLIDLAPRKGQSRFDDCLGDFKTARDAAVKEWAKKVNGFGYHIQAALELDIYNLATGEKRSDFRHVIQENIAPYQPAKRIIDLEFIQSGRDAYKAALAWYSHCLHTGEWPDYDGTAPGIGGWSFVSQTAWMLKE